MLCSYIYMCKYRYYLKTCALSRAGYVQSYMDIHVFCLTRNSMVSVIIKVPEYMSTMKLL